VVPCCLKNNGNFAKDELKKKELVVISGHGRVDKASQIKGGAYLAL